MPHPSFCGGRIAVLFAGEVSESKQRSIKVSGAVECSGAGDSPRASFRSLSRSAHRERSRVSVKPLAACSPPFSPLIYASSDHHGATRVRSRRLTAWLPSRRVSDEVDAARGQQASPGGGDALRGINAGEGEPVSALGKLVKRGPNGNAGLVEGASETARRDDFER